MDEMTRTKWDDLCHDVRNGCLTIALLAKKVENAGIRLNILKEVKRIEIALDFYGLKTGKEGGDD